MSSLTKPEAAKNHSRRSFMSWAALAPAVIASAPVASATPATAPTGPLTPAEYLAEMRAIGWSAVALCWRGKPVHVCEYQPPDERKYTPENQFAFGLIQRRVGKSGDDFWKRTSVYLFSLGLRRDLEKGVQS
jgi:hypothetical protein